MSERAATDAEIVRAKSMAEAGFGGTPGNILSLIARIDQERAENEQLRSEIKVAQTALSDTKAIDRLVDDYDTLMREKVALEEDNARLTAERDAALAEGVVLRGFFDEDKFGGHLAGATEDGVIPMDWSLAICRMVEEVFAQTPLVSAHLAEVERLRRVEKAAKGLNDCPPSPHNGWWKELSAALAAYDAARGGGGGRGEEAEAACPA